MRDVARAANVSVATVSHVVNDKPGARIGEETRRRVIDAVRELGYRTNALARTLSQGRSQFIGLVADHIATTPFAGQIIKGAQHEAWRHGYVLLVANTDGDRALERDAISMMLEYQVEGILYSTWYHRRVEVPSALVGTRVALVNCFSDEGGVPSVVPDEVQGGQTATSFLLDAGHTRVAFVNTTTPSPARTGRLEGYRRAMERAGLDVDRDLVIDAEPDQEGGYGAAARLVDLGVTGVFCHNDRVAMGLYDGLRERGLSVPEDVSVVGFDNQEVIAAHLRPPLTTVALPHDRIGSEGVRALLGNGPVGAGVVDRGHDFTVGGAVDSMRHVMACPPVARSSVRTL